MNHFDMRIYNNLCTFFLWHVYLLLFQKRSCKQYALKNANTVNVASGMLSSGMLRSAFLQLSCKAASFRARLFSASIGRHRILVVEISKTVSTNR